jgi:hypothetical protein
MDACATTARAYVMRAVRWWVGLQCFLLPAFTYVFFALGGSRLPFAESLVAWFALVSTSFLGTAACALIVAALQPYFVAWMNSFRAAIDGRHG